MRVIAGIFGLAAGIGLAWSAGGFVGAFWNVHQMDAGSEYSAAAEQALIRKGLAANTALRYGLSDDNPFTSLRCAKILMLNGDDAGEDFLLDALRLHPAASDAYGRAADGFLLEAWDLRNGPDAKLRQQLREVESNSARVPETLLILNECLNRNPGWADGYARRARLFQQGGEAYEARRDALSALALAPNHYLARATLGRVEMAVDAPYLAFKSFEHAVTLNPRMRASLQRELDEASRALDLENEKRREERRRSVPVA